MSTMPQSGDWRRTSGLSANELLRAECRMALDSWNKSENRSFSRRYVERTGKMNATISTPKITVSKSRKLENSWVILWWIWNTVPFHDVCHLVLEYDKAIHEWLIESAILDLWLWVDFRVHRSSSKGTLADFHSKAKSVLEALPKSNPLKPGGDHVNYNAIHSSPKPQNPKTPKPQFNSYLAFHCFTLFL